MTNNSPAPDTATLLEFLFRLGQAYIACGEQTARVELALRRTASAYGLRKSRVVAFPTALFISVHDETGERVTLAQCEPQTLRLDQIADVHTLGKLAKKAEVEPNEGLRRLSEILAQKARFGAAGSVVGHMILTIGLAMVLMPTAANLAAAAVLGSIVGVVKLAQRGRTVQTVPLPVIVAALVSTLVFLAVRYGLPVDPLHALVPPLITFLPGGMLTLGMVELAYGDMVSGASRLIAGLVQLVLLTLGLAVGAVLVGYSPNDLIYSAEQYVKLFEAAWVGVLVFGLGVYLHFSAPRYSLLWILIVLLIVMLVQRLTGQFLGYEISGFFGTLVATPLSYLIQLRFRGPPATVTFLPAFWLLVPGALGLLSVTRMMSDRAAGIEGLVTVVFVISSIALGTLVGAAVYKWFTETFNWWQLQIGRVESSVRRAKKR
ncbi:threonine/serine ThrE exporter family protein [Desulfonatronum thioautotrophicum]|uniref:threonine/serine ThrE exporter family protein n=1 Tax=Desulfonatronum thioautotrophicum TaxID=617001 RepID=UPI0013791503|nr:threonine/serine exporter family protein [Desulfonatronum thioautotrophicum]